MIILYDFSDVCHNFIEDFLNCIYEEYWPVITFSILSFSMCFTWFWYQVDAYLQSKFRHFLSLQFLRNNRRVIDVNSSLDVCWNSPRLLFVFSLLIQLCYDLLVCLYFLFPPDSVLGNCAYLRICPILLGLQFYWHIIILSDLLW